MDEPESTNDEHTWLVGMLYNSYTDNLDNVVTKMKNPNVT